MGALKTICGLRLFSVTFFCLFQQVTSQGLDIWQQAIQVAKTAVQTVASQWGFGEAVAAGDWQRVAIELIKTYGVKAGMYIWNKFWNKIVHLGERYENSTLPSENENQGYNKAESNWQIWEVIYNNTYVAEKSQGHSNNPTSPDLISYFNTFVTKQQNEKTQSVGISDKQNGDKGSSTDIPGDQSDSKTKLDERSQDNSEVNSGEISQEQDDKKVSPSNDEIRIPIIESE